MSAYLDRTIDDLRHGRESWRVILLLSVTALLITTSAQLLIR